MTTRATNDPPTRDPRFDAAWRAASSEEPPPALDAAILAAAHREAGAKPQSLSAQAAMRARRRWWPLAAAETVAVIAIGVVQRAGRDDLVTPPSGSTVVSDIPAQSPKKVAESNERAPEAPATAAPVDSRPGASAPPRKKTEPVASEAVPSEKRPKAINASAPAPEPFPAAKAKLDAAERDATAAGAPIAKTAPESAALQRNEGGSASAMLAAPSTPSAASPTQSPAPPMSSPSPPIPNAAAPMSSAASFADSGRVAAPATRQSSVARAGTGGATAEARAKDRGPLPVADWITLIRRLRDEGNIAEAARELAAFRTAHPDHEKLLPPDLRDWHPLEK